MAFKRSAANHRTTEDNHDGQRRKSSGKGSNNTTRQTMRAVSDMNADSAPTSPRTPSIVESRHRRSTLDAPPVPKACSHPSKTASSEAKAQQTKIHSRIEPQNEITSVRRHASNEIKLSILNPLPRGNPERRVEILSTKPVVRRAPENKVIRNVARNYERRKSGGLFSQIFGAANAMPEQRITCLTCMSDDVPVGKSAKLACSHHLCHDCLKRIFTMSLTDPQHMPPKCCTSDHIPLEHVEKLFDTKFKIKWNRKYQEYKTKNRIYCPAKSCGVWIKPSRIFVDTISGSTDGRNYGKCPRCKTKVCCRCNGKWHSEKDCPKDESIQTFVEMAREMGWKRCHSCSAMVELKEGCNHMTCRCTAEFCMVCGSKWKTCDCPWFNYNTGGEGDQLNFMNAPWENVARRQGGHQGDFVEGEARYQDELRWRTAQEQDDEDLARRLQARFGF